MPTKIEWRETLRQQRRSISQQQRSDAAVAAAKCLITHPLFHTSQHIACYYASDAEFDTWPIIKAIWAAQKTCYLPTVSAEPQGLLTFFAYHEDDALMANRYAILEPLITHTQPFPTEQLDIVFVPLLGFDHQGHRLGTGGGYYDRTFVERKTRLIGLAYQQQQVDALPSDPWDVSLDGVLTEQGLVLFP